MTRRYHLNVVGPFYVEDGCCTLCGVPESEAPGLFGSDNMQCFVKKQPETSGQLAAMLMSSVVRSWTAYAMPARTPRF